MRLYDSSAIINLCAQRKTDELLEGYTLDLAPYEIGNAVWKQVHIHKTITEEEANTTLDALTEIIKNMKSIEAEEPLEILRIAIEGDLTYYDASYLHTAIKNDLALITDDQKLHTVAKKYIETIKTDTQNRGKTEGYR